MKKLAAIFIAALMAASLSACGEWEIEIRNPEENNLNIGEVELITQDEAKKTVPPPAAEGDFIVLETGENFTMREAVLEFADRILVYSVGGEIGGFDIKTGEKVYSVMLGNWNEIGFVMMKKTDEKAGFDYCVYTKENMIFLSSTDPDKFLSEALPKEITESNMFGGITGNWYSTDGSNILWQNKDGIMVMPKEGGKEKLILSNADIEKDIIPAAEKAFEEGFSGNNGGPYIYLAPEFICGGTKIAVTVTSWDYVFWAAALYDLETQRFEWVYSFAEQDVAQYPIADRYVVIRTSAGVKLIDTQIGESENVERFAGYAFENGEKISFALSQWNNVGGDFELFISDDTVKDDGDRILAKVDDPTVSGSICGITESYIAFHIYDEDNEWDCIVNFKDSE